jgi:hypothetical protein
MPVSSRGEWEGIGALSLAVLETLRPCPHILEAQSWDKKRFPSHRYALSTAEKAACLEREILRCLLSLVDEGLIREAARLLKGGSNPEKVPDLWFRDTQDRDYLVEAKNLWYHPLDEIGDPESLRDGRFHLQNMSWVKSKIRASSWARERYYTKDISKRVHGERFYRRVDVHPSKVLRVYISTIPSFNSEQTENTFLSFFDEWIFTLHPIPDINSPHLKERYFIGRQTRCVTIAVERLQNALRDYVVANDN